jgi:hypothetical protein
MIIVGMLKKPLGAAIFEVVPPSLAFTFMATLEQYWGWAFTTWAMLTPAYG